MTPLPSGGEGLGALCEGLATGVPALVILNLSATGLTDDHIPALRALSQVSDHGVSVTTFNTT